MSEPPLKKRKLDDGAEVSKEAEDQENPGSENDEDADPSQNNSEENSSDNEGFSFASNSIEEEEFIKILKSKELFKEWVDKQKENGLDADDIFFKLGFPEDMVMTLSVKGLGEGLLDKILEQDNPYDTLLDVHGEIEEMAEMLMNHRKKLPDINTADDAIERIKNAKRVLVVSGAGVSVSSGIPDFRSPGGLYDQIQQKYTLPDPHCLFDIDYLKKDPIPFFDFSKQLYPGEAKPAAGHKFVRLLETKSQLLRNYTQNIDTLEKIAGINKVLLCHGSFATASCITCKIKVEGESLREEIMASKIPYCKECKDEKSFMKPGKSETKFAELIANVCADIVFFGEALPQEFFDTIQEDCKACDLLIVMGSSLKVHPVALIPRVIAELNPEIPQFLINNQVVYEPHEWDYCFLGNIDDSVKIICDKLGWNMDDTAQQQAKPEAVVLTPKKKPSVNNVSVNNTDNNDPPAETTDDQKDPQ